MLLTHLTLAGCWALGEISHVKLFEATHNLQSEPHTTCRLSPSLAEYWGGFSLIQLLEIAHDLQGDSIIHGHTFAFVRTL